MVGLESPRRGRAHAPQPPPHPPRAAAAVGRDRPTRPFHTVVRLRIRLRGADPRRELQGLRDRRPDAAQLDDLVDGHRCRPDLRPHDRGDRPLPDAADVAIGSPRRSFGRGSPLSGDLHRHRRAHRTGDRLATDASPASIAAGFGVALLFSYALSWACACLGIVSKGPESAQGIGLIILFPLAIVSNAMVPTAGMPGWLQVIANWNPVSCRHRSSEAPLRKSKPVELASRLADATPGRRGTGVVACDTDRLRPFGRAPVPPKDDGVTSIETTADRRLRTVRRVPRGTISPIARRHWVTDRAV